MISMDKKYRTRGGRDVRVLCTDAPGAFPVVGYYVNDGLDARVTSRAWREDGRTNPAGQIDNVHDLIEVRSAEDVVRDALDDAWANSADAMTNDTRARTAVTALREAGLLRED